MLFVMAIVFLTCLCCRCVMEPRQYADTVDILVL